MYNARIIKFPFIFLIKYEFIINAICEDNYAALNSGFSQRNSRNVGLRVAALIKDAVHACYVRT